MLFKIIGLHLIKDQESLTHFKLFFSRIYCSKPKVIKNRLISFFVFKSTIAWHLNSNGWYGYKIFNIRRPLEINRIKSTNMFCIHFIKSIRYSKWSTYVSKLYTIPLLNLENYSARYSYTSLKQWNSFN